MNNLLKELCLLNGISGREDNVRNYIISQVENYADSIETDPLGNLIVFKKGAQRAKNKVMLDAHMDEVGFIITNINSDGTLSFECVGGINTAVMTGRAVTVGDKKISGVIGVVPIHLLPLDKKTELPDKSSMVIDIGCFSKEEAEQLVRIGDYACFDSEYVEFGDGMIKSKALDDRVGCAALIKMIQTPQKYDLYFSFSTGEETGLGSAATAAYRVAPDYAIVSETTTAADLSGVEENQQVCVLGGGGAVSFMDRRTVYNNSLFRRALDIAKENNISAQPKTKVAGGNNAGHIHKTAGGIKTITVSVPCRYLHSPSCVIKMSDAEESLKLMTALAEEFADD